MANRVGTYEFRFGHSQEPPSSEGVQLRLIPEDIAGFGDGWELSGDHYLLGVRQDVMEADHVLDGCVKDGKLRLLYSRLAQRTGLPVFGFVSLWPAD